MVSATSYTVNVSENELDGFCRSYEFRLHLYEYEANLGSYECRREWVERVGPNERFGGCNPLNGHFVAVTLPLCKPERLRAIAYMQELDAFLLDNKIDLDPPTQDENDIALLTERKENASGIEMDSGCRWIHKKMMRQLKSIEEEEGVERIVSSWKEWVRTTAGFKGAKFESIDDFVRFRVVDCAAAWVEATMLWGMGITLTEKEDEVLHPIKYPCFATLGLTNDYYSFDREMEESKDPNFDPVNSVQLNMLWHNINSSAAKLMVKNLICQYEQEFLDRCKTWRAHAPVSEKLDKHLEALAYMIIGNNVWSMNSPRYQKAFRYNADDMEKEIRDHDVARLKERGLQPLTITLSSL